MPWIAIKLPGAEADSLGKRAESAGTGGRAGGAHPKVSRGGGAGGSRSVTTNGAPEPLGDESGTTIGLRRGESVTGKILEQVFSVRKGHLSDGMSRGDGADRNPGGFFGRPQVTDRDLSHRTGFSAAKMRG